MFLWFLVLSVVITFLVFQSPLIDYRLVALGSVLPLIETPFGAGPLHSLLAPTVVLAVVMLANPGRRLTQRRWLGVPIGMYLHLVLDGAFLTSSVFWWPFTGVGLDWPTAPEFGRGWFSGAMELVALIVASWAWGRFGFDDPDRRRLFLRQGHLDRAVLS